MENASQRNGIDLKRKGKRKQERETFQEFANTEEIKVKICNFNRDS